MLSKIHLRASDNFKKFPGLYPDPLTRGRGGKGRRAKEGQGEEGGEGRERTMKGRGQCDGRAGRKGRREEGEVADLRGNSIHLLGSI